VASHNLVHCIVVNSHVLDTLMLTLTNVHTVATGSIILFNCIAESERLSVDLIPRLIVWRAEFVSTRRGSFFRSPSLLHHTLHRATAHLSLNYFTAFRYVRVAPRLSSRTY